MAFEPYRGPMGAFVQHSVGLLATVAAVKGKTFKIDAATGYAELGAAADATLKGVFMETKTAGATSGADKVNVVYFREGQEWIVDCTGTPAQTSVGAKASLTDVNTLDEDDTGNTPLFDIVGIYGAAADKKVIVKPIMSYFTGGSA